MNQHWVTSDDAGEDVERINESILRAWGGVPHVGHDCDDSGHADRLHWEPSHPLHTLPPVLLAPEIQVSDHTMPVFHVLPVFLWVLDLCLCVEVLLFILILSLIIQALLVYIFHPFHWNSILGYVFSFHKTYSISKEDYPNISRTIMIRFSIYSAEEHQL